MIIVRYAQADLAFLGDVVRDLHVAHGVWVLLLKWVDKAGTAARAQARSGQKRAGQTMKASRADVRISVRISSLSLGHTPRRKPGQQ